MLLREGVGSIGVGCEFEAGEVVVYEIARVHGFGLTLLLSTRFGCCWGGWWRHDVTDTGLPR